VYRWFLREVVEIGYPGYNKNRARYDAEMLKRYGGGRAREGWADRIGKKYYWILLQRLVGQLSDHLPRRDFGDPVPLPSDPPLQAVELRQLDPTDLRAYQPEEPNNLDEWYAGKAYDFDEGLTTSDRAWVSKFDFLDVTEFLESRDMRGESWVPLELEMDWEVNLSEDPDADYPRRVVQLQLDSVLLAQEWLPELIEKLEELRSCLDLRTGPSRSTVASSVSILTGRSIVRGSRLANRPSKTMSMEYLSPTRPSICFGSLSTTIAKVRNVTWRLPLRLWLVAAD
jgi:hypothetical protein